MKILLLLLLSIVFNLFTYDCSGQRRESQPFLSATKVVYHFGHSSVPPEYHRSYTITVTRSNAKLIVESYGTIINESLVTITEKQFNEVLEAIRAASLRR